MTTPSHLTLPFTLAASGGLASAPQDSTGDVAVSVRLLLATRPGERASVPGYGTPDQLYAPNQAQLVDAVALWEPRVVPTIVSSARQPAVLTRAGILSDGTHVGFYLLDGSLLVEDPDHPGFYIDTGSHLVADIDDPGFFDTLNLYGSDPNAAASIAIAATITTGASEADQ